MLRCISLDLNSIADPMSPDRKKTQSPKLFWFTIIKIETGYIVLLVILYYITNIITLINLTKLWIKKVHFKHCNPVQLLFTCALYLCRTKLQRNNS